MSDHAAITKRLTVREFIMFVKIIEKKRYLFISHNFNISETRVEDIFGEKLASLENWCALFNNLCFLLFNYMKFVIFFINLSMGILLLLKLKNSNFQARFRSLNDEIVEDEKGYTENLDKVRLLVGLFYIFVGFGFLFDFFTYFLIWILDPLPDRLIFSFINFSSSIDPQNLNRIIDLNSTDHPHEVTVYLCVVIGSEGVLIELMVSFWHIIVQKKSKYKKAFPLLIGGVIMGFLTGFTTCLPFFL